MEYFFAEYRSDHRQNKLGLFAVVYCHPVFDTSAPTERHTTLLDYKANREEMPGDIRSNLPYIRRIIESYQYSHSGERWVRGG